MRKILDPSLKPNLDFIKGIWPSQLENWHLQHSKGLGLPLQLYSSATSRSKMTVYEKEFYKVLRPPQNRVLL